MIRLAIAALLLCGPAWADDIRVVSSGGLSAAYKVLAPRFEAETGHHLITEWGPSMGTTEFAVPTRLARGEPIDVVIMVGYALGQLVEKGVVAADSRADIARSGIYVAVRAGAPHPDVSTADALRRALLAAPSVAYSDSASGVYIEREMFAKLGITAEMKATGHMIPAEPVAGVVARGDAAIGFQQLSELKPVPGIDILGPVPPGLQQITVFSGGVLAASRVPGPARALVQYLASPAAAQAITDSGMEPFAGR